MNEEKRIDAERIYIRPIDVEDTEAVLKLRNSENVVKHFIYRKVITKEDHLNWLKTKVNTGNVVQFVVCDKKTDDILGSVYTQNANSEDRIGESGIFLGDVRRLGTGVGQECYALLIKYSFEVLNLYELKAKVLANNPASQRLHEKLGYVREKYLEDGVSIEGKTEDLIIYSLKNTMRLEDK